MANKKNGNNPEQETPDLNLSESQIKKLIDDAEKDPLDKAFSAESGFNAARAMIELKEALENNALLLDIPDKRTATALTYAWYQYTKHNNPDRKKARMIQVALWAAIKGKRTEKFVEAITWGHHPIAKNDWAQGAKDYIFGDKNK